MEDITALYHYHIKPDTTVDVLNLIKAVNCFIKVSGELCSHTHTHLVAALSVQTGRGNKAGPVLPGRGQEDEVTGESLVFLHHHHISNLRPDGEKRERQLRIDFCSRDR